MLTDFEKFGNNGLAIRVVKNGIVHRFTRTTIGTATITLTGYSDVLRNLGLSHQDRGDIRI